MDMTQGAVACLTRLLLSCHNDIMMNLKLSAVKTPVSSRREMIQGFKAALFSLEPLSVHLSEMYQRDQETHRLKSILIKTHAVSH